MPRSSNVVKNPGKSGLEPHLADRNILRFIDAAKSLSTKQNGSLVRAFPINAVEGAERMFEGMLLSLLSVEKLWTTATVSRFKFRTVYTQAYAYGECMLGANPRLNNHLGNANTIDSFFGPIPRGVLTKSSESPLNEGDCFGAAATRCMREVAYSWF